MLLSSIMMMQHCEAVMNLLMVLRRDKLIEYAEERIEFRKQRC